MLIKISKHFAKLIHFILRLIAALAIAYAVVFSIAGTVALYYGYHFVMKPYEEVRALKAQQPHESSYMALKRTQLRTDGKPDTLLFTYVPLDSISPDLAKAVIAVEDDAFWVHPGFDVEAMIQAYQYNKDHGKLKKGASTLTQQLAKNLFASPEKTYMRKAREMIYTILMEQILGKNRILELYLNYAQFGKNIYGAEAAAQTFYHKHAKNLTADQAYRLAAVLAMPDKVSPLNANSVFIQKRLAVIYSNLYKHDADTTAADSSDSDGGESSAGTSAVVGAVPVAADSASK